jgi:hypothetical protein
VFGALGIREYLLKAASGAVNISLGAAGVPTAYTLVPAGVQHRATFWIKSGAFGSDAGWALEIRDVTLPGGTTALLVSAAIPTLSTGYTQMTTSFTSVTGAVQLRLVKTGTFGDAWLTGVMISAGATPTRYNLGTVGDAITADVQSFTTSIGRPGLWHYAGSGSARVVLDNNPATYPIAAWMGRRVVIAHEESGLITVLFSGILSRWIVDAGLYSERRAAMELLTPDVLLERAEAVTQLFVSVRVDEVVKPLMRDSVGMSVETFPYAVRGQGYIPAYVGADVPEGMLVGQFLDRLAASDGGRFYADRYGQLTFLSRAEMMGEQSGAAVSPIAADYEYVSLVNVVTADIVPRSVGTPGATIWTLAAPQRRPRGESRVKARLIDGKGNPAACSTLIAPVAYTDYTFNAASDGTGTDYTGSVTLTGVAFGTVVELVINNAAPVPVWLIAGSKLRGTLLTRADTMRVRVGAAATDRSLLQNARHYEWQLVSSVEDAEDRLNYEYARYSIGHGRWSRVLFQQPTGAALTSSLFDAVTLTDTHTGTTATHWIIAERHEVNIGGRWHMCEWDVEPTNPAGWWILGVTAWGRLGVSP